MDVEALIARLDWPGIEAMLDQDGCVVLPGLLTPAQVREFAALQETSLSLAAELRAALVRRLAPITARWSGLLGTGHGDAGPPASLRAAPRPALARLREGEYQPLRNDAGEAQVPAFRMTALLSEPGAEFSGGEFVLVEQRPRMQSRPMVLPLRKADVAIFAGAHRPHRGSRGYYRVTLKHAVSRVRSGERLALDLALH